MHKVVRFIYKYLLKPILFKFDPESVHDRAIKAGIFFGKSKLDKWVIRQIFGYENSALTQRIHGLKFKNPVGLSGGFDKNAELLQIIGDIGFGFSEVGSITYLPYEGNPRPRLWRLKESKALVVWYGLKNKGAKYILDKTRNLKPEIIVGTNIAMTNCAKNMDTKEAIKDYVESFKIFSQPENLGHYITINVSCPNTQGDRPFSDNQRLDSLLTELDKIRTGKPVFIKISPDLSRTEIDEFLRIIRNHNVQGIICSNLTKNRNNDLIIEKDLPEVGGISGRPLQNLTDNLIAYIYKNLKTNRETDKYIIIASGGIDSPEEAYRKIRLGASLIQMITGLIYEGPQLVKEINQGLVEKIQSDGFSNIKEAIGADIE